MRYRKTFKLLIFCTLFFVSTSKCFSQNNNAAFAAADSVRFSVSHGTGWQLFNSYVNQFKTDSAQIELILQHDNNITWNQEQYVGKIKYGPLLPSSAQVLYFFLLSDKYALRIEPNGKCYLRFVSGSLPAANPVVLPIKAYYKL